MSSRLSFVPGGTSLALAFFVSDPPPHAAKAAAAASATTSTAARPARRDVIDSGLPMPVHLAAHGPVGGHRTPSGQRAGNAGFGDSLAGAYAVCGRANRRRADEDRSGRQG